MKASYIYILLRCVWLLVIFDWTNAECVFVEDICFEDMGENEYVESRIVNGNVVRQVIVRTTTGTTYALSAIGGDYGYMFEQSTVQFSGPVVISSPNILHTIPSNGAEFQDKIVVAKAGGCFDEVKAAMASMFGAKGLVILGAYDRAFGRMGAHPCMTRGFIRRDFAVVIIQDIAQTQFFIKLLLNNTIETVSIASAGSNIGEICGMRRGRQRSPYCSGYMFAHECDKETKTCVCNEPLYTNTTIDGQPSCFLAAGQDPHNYTTSHSTCLGYLLPLMTGCNSATWFCSDFPTTVCYNNKCYCQIGYSLLGKIGDKFSKCIPTERYLDPCLNVHLQGNKTVVTKKEKEFVELCMVSCYDIGPCVAFHIHRILGTCITYKKNEAIPAYPQSTWLFYKI